MSSSLEEVGRLGIVLSGDASQLTTALKQARTISEGELDRLTRRYFLFTEQMNAAIAAGNTKLAASFKARLKAISNAVDSEIAKLNNLKNVASGLQGGYNPLQQILGGSRIGQGFLMGGGIGAGIAAFQAGIGAAKELGTWLFHLGEESVQTAARFEVTRNALAAMTGSASQARAELQAIDEVARHTTGLRLEDAEQGYTRLRALGFEAKTVTGIITGLAKQKLLSGADEQAVERVIINLQQLSAGSTRAAMDVKEMIHSMPTLTSTMVQAFGTMNFGAVGQIFNKNPQEAMARFAAAVEETKQAEGGLTAATVEFHNQWVLTQRSFAEPLLPELTHDLKALAGILESAAPAARSWGQTFSDVIAGVRTNLSELNDFITNHPYIASVMGLGVGGAVLTAGARNAPQTQSSNAGNFARGALTTGLLATLTPGGIGGYLYSASQTGAANRVPGSTEDFTTGVSMLNRNPQLAGQMFGGSGLSKEEFAQTLLVKSYNKEKGIFEERLATYEEFQVNLQRARERAITTQETAEKRELELLKQGNAERESILSAQHKINLARIEGEKAFTPEAQISQLRAVSAENRRFYQESAAEVSDYYNKQIAQAQATMERTHGTNEQVIALESEKRNKLRALEADEFKRQMDAARQIEAAQEQAREKERRATVQHHNILIAGFKQYEAAQLTELKRLSDKSDSQVEYSYDRQVQIIQESQQRILTEMRANLALQLQDIRLSESERQNLRDQEAQAEQALAIETKNKVIAVEEEKSNRILDIMSRRYQQIIETAQREQKISGAFAGTDYTTFSHKELTNLAETFEQTAIGLQKGRTSDFERALDQAKTLRSEIAELNKQWFDADSHHRAEEALAIQTQINDKQHELNVALREGEAAGTESIQLWRALPSAVEEFARQLKGITKPEDLDQFALTQLRNQGDAMIRELDAKVQQAAARYTKMLADNASGTPGLKHSDAELQSAKGALDNASAERSAGIWEVLVKNANAYDQTLAGLKEKYRDISAGEYDLSIKNKAEAEVWAEKNQLLTEVKTLELGYYRDTVTEALRVKDAKLKAEKELYDARIKALEDVARAEVIIDDQMKYHHEQVYAAIMTQLSKAPSMTDIFSQAEAGAVESMYGAIDSSVAALVQHLGLANTAMGTFIQTILSGLAKLAAAKFIGFLIKLLGGGLASSGSGVTNTSIGSWDPNVWSFAEGGLVRASAGGTPIIAGEGGYDEVVMSTDPRHAAKNAYWMQKLGGRLLPASSRAITPMVSSGGSGNVFAPSFNFYPDSRTGKFNRESAEQATKKLTAMQRKIAGR